jgi:hypothetical protein
MGSEQPPRIVSSERTSTGIVVTFADGRCAFYSASILDAAFSQAEDLTNLPADEIE